MRWKMMGASTFACVLLAATFGVIAGDPSDALANPTTMGAKPASPAKDEPPTVEKAVRFDLAGVGYGQSIKQVIAAVEKILDEDYKPLYAKVSPGVKMKQLDAALAEEKAAFARSRVDFAGQTTPFDAGPMKGEFTHGNDESMLVLPRKGSTYHFFFIRGAFWKLIVERRLGEGEPAGKNFADAAGKVGKELGAQGRARPADATAGRHFPEVDWKDPRTHLRAIDRGVALVAFAYEELATVAQLPVLRAPKSGVIKKGK